MSDLKFVILCNTFLMIAYCACVTTAAIHFDSVNILWWYLLVGVMGYNYESDKRRNNL